MRSVQESNKVIQMPVFNWFTNKGVLDLSRVSEKMKMKLVNYSKGLF